MKLSELMSHCVLGAGSAELAEAGEDWMQGRSAFGGLQAAVALRAMRTLVDAPLRTLQMSFIAPVGPGLRARARVLRAGKNATHVEARLGAGDETLALIVGVFGIRRDSIVRHDVAAAVAMPILSKPTFAPGTMPKFMQHFDVALLAGAAPFTGARTGRAVYQLGLLDDGPASEAHLLAFADFVPPVALSWMPKPVPGASMTWMLEMLIDDLTSLPLDGWRADTRMLAAAGGYTSQATTIYAPDGTAAALSQQSMVVFG